MTAEAPSLTGEELPAVTVPFSLKAVLNVANFSKLEDGRGVSSTPTSPIATISSLKIPA